RQRRPPRAADCGRVITAHASQRGVRLTADARTTWPRGSQRPSWRPPAGGTVAGDAGRPLTLLSFATKTAAGRLDAVVARGGPLASELVRRYNRFSWHTAASSRRVSPGRPPGRLSTTTCSRTATASWSGSL